jgi:class 3 adenylate cyclase
MAANGGEVVISEAVDRLVQLEVTVSREFETKVKGIQSPVPLFVVKNLAPL